MKAASLLALRVSTGLLLVWWGLVKIMAQDRALAISNKFYAGVFSTEIIQTALGAAQILLGALVIVGLFRRATYTLQAIVLVGGALFIWRYLLDPLGLYLFPGGGSQLLFFPSTTVAIASILLLAFLSDDHFALDRLRSGR
ncbi:MAG: hypothetical protein AAFZ01_09250 [Pseudomonadota bacterium]